MKIFESEWKINFVDDNNVLVGFDNCQNCCENFGYTLTRKVPNDGCIESEHRLDPEGFQFDTGFIFSQEKTEMWEEGGMVTFKMTKGDEVMYLNLYNHHNGFYSHGFEMKINDQVERSGSL